MNDSLIVQKLIVLKQFQDSTNVHLSNIEQVLNSNKSESILLKLLPFLGVLVGGLITWFVQRSVKNFEFKLLVEKEIRDVSCRVLTSLTIMQFHLKELAFLEVDSKYQYYLSHSADSEEGKKRALEEHYNDYTYISNVKEKLSSCVADVNSTVSSYYKLSKKNMPDDVSNLLLKFTKHILSLQRAEEFDFNTEVTSDDLKRLIDELSAEYTLHIDDMLDKVKAL
jgi:hypothetical protein